MFTLTDKAKEELDAYFDGKDIGAIRVHLSGGGCSGPRLMLALDEPTDADQVFQQDDYSFCIDKELLKQVESIKIDFTYMGFSVTPGVSLGGGGCGPSGCCGGCSGA